MTPKLTALLFAAITLLALLVVSAVGFAFIKQQAVTNIYRDRLHQLSAEYEDLRGQYNDAVRKAAVTELVVEQGTLSVHLVDVHGRNRVLTTDVDPELPVYVDYLVQHDRLWVRSVYDASRSPQDAMILDEAYRDIDWEDPATRYGLVAYRKLTEGRWVVTATQNGALALVPAGDTPVELVPPPPMLDFKTVDQEVAADLDRLSIGDVLNQYFGGP